MKNMTATTTLLLKKKKYLRDNNTRCWQTQKLSCAKMVVHKRNVSYLFALFTSSICVVLVVAPTILSPQTILFDFERTVVAESVTG